jgi:FkbM family methyltransferase
VRGKILDAITEENTAFLAKGRMRFPDRHSTWTLIHEILLNEDYFFDSQVESPSILDCGTHIGVSIYYWKSLFPKAKVIGFEPVPYLREIALANIEENGFSDVVILPYALSESSGEAVFRVSKSYSMAGSLANRRELVGDEIEEIQVECRTLSSFLNDRVDFLKLDIEGSEDSVLMEAENNLANVRNLFCEVHEGLDAKTSRLLPILSILERVGFDVQIGKSYNFEKSSRNRPMESFEGPRSQVLWAKNRRPD